jgi:hypothetical protein
MAIFLSCRQLAALGGSQSSLRQQPCAYKPGDLVAVLVDHHHVQIALDTQVGQIDKVDAAARALQCVRVFDVSGAYLRSCRLA